MNYDKIIVEMLSRIQKLEEKVEIKAFIEKRIGEAFANGERDIIIKAIDIHKAMGLKSGYSSTLEIKYFK